MTVQTVAGLTMFIGPVTAAADIAAYEALAPWVEVGEIEDPGEWGDEYGSAEFQNTKERRKRKLKTTADAGSPQITLGRDPSDLGQAALKLALASDDNYAFYYQFQDGEKHFFHAQVMSFKNQTGSAEDIVKATCSLAINTEIFEKPAP